MFKATSHHCYVCDSEINESNKYTEHIILNAIGGRLKSKNIICKDCERLINQDGIDANLARQLNPFGLGLNIKRDYRKNPSIEAKTLDKGETIRIQGGGIPQRVRPYIEENFKSDEPSLRVSANSRKQLREVLKGYSRKGILKLTPKEIEEVIEAAKESREYLGKITYDVDMGGERTWRALCKMAVNFFIFSDGEKKYIKHLIPYMKGDESRKVCWYYYPPSSTPVTEHSSRIEHKLILNGDPEEQILYVKIELFSALKYIVLLSDTYDGEPIKNNYCFDLMSSEKLEIHNDQALKRETIYSVLNQTTPPIQTIRSHLSGLQGFIHNIQVDSSISELCQDAWSETRSQHSDADIFTEEMMMSLLRLLAERFVAFLMRNPQE